MKVKKADVWPIVERVFPDYGGRKFSIEFTDHIYFSNTNWSGGSKNSYAMVHVDGRTGAFVAPAPWNNPVEGKRVELTPTVIVVCHSRNCGVDTGITIYAHPVHAPKWLKGV